MNLRELAAMAETGTVLVRGQKVTVFPLDGNDQAVVDGTFPRPTPARTRKDPEKGSLAPEIPDFADPEYLVALECWWHVYRSAYAAAAVRHAAGGEPYTGVNAEYLRRAAKDLACVDRRIIAEIYEKSRELSYAGTAHAAENAAGN